MRSTSFNPQNALNKAFRKVKPSRADFETFKAQLGDLLAGVKPSESEEFHKNLIADFLKKTHYGARYINTKGRNDLVIHEGKGPDAPVGVIIETKKPGNKGEMLLRDDLNRKALHELVLYYLRERVTHKNVNLKHLIATDTFEWFVFDANEFERAFVDDKAFVKTFEDFEKRRLTGHKTEFFYNTIAKPFIARLTRPLSFTYVDLRDYQNLTGDPGGEKRLVTLYKFFSPEHLLKLPFANDSNTLDRAFYAELLHIIGLAETKVGGKKLITRREEARRGDASLLENAIIQLDDHDKISRLAEPEHYGKNREERLFNVALELVITWVNRVLFLKLLESQLKSYHKGEEGDPKGANAYGFLNAERLPNYDELDTLFFGVLARPPSERREPARGDFAGVPYLNSSLFEPTELEHRALFIGNLRDDRELELHPNTVLKTADGKKRTGSLDTLAYLFEFLDAYDFSSEGAETVQEENKTLINASVLGLIFEKINGYKDGSFFTPGFVTMYMCRETVRRAVVQKFNEAKGWTCATFADLYNAIENTAEGKREANRIVNSLKICDPAVGSGHFLVSALNELLSVKSELKILADSDGKTLRDYTLEVSNDELIVTGEDGELFGYNPRNPESQRVQKTLFFEKQTLIENCLFGVDVNPNSVKICRLRLWIELLKHAYYRDDGQLETLPNIDINIKTGNSLVSRFALDADLKHALKKSDHTIEDYRNAVSAYRNAADKAQKREMERLIASIKDGFRVEIANNDPKVLRLEKLKITLATLEQTTLFEETSAQKKERERVEKEVGRLQAELEEARSNKIFENAFEWRFEFPEVLGDDGEFVGFDVIIGNPPYIRQEELSSLKGQLQQTYETYHGSADLLVYFVELGVKLLRERGSFSYIIANKWMRANYGKPLRAWLKAQQLLQIIDYGDLPVFEEATTYPCILSMAKGEPGEEVRVVKMGELAAENLGRYVREHGYTQAQSELDDNGWSLANRGAQKVLDKLSKVGVPLEQYVDGKIYYGIKTGFNDAFVIDEETKNRLIAEDPKSAEVIKPFLAGRDIKRYASLDTKNYLIFTRRGIDINSYPAIKSYLLDYKERLEPKPKDWQGKSWKGRKAGPYAWYEVQDSIGYHEEFEKEKIVFAEIALKGQFTLDKCNYYYDTTAYILGDGSKYLLGILNSELWNFMFASVSSEIRGGYLRWKRQYMAPLPIRTIDPTNSSDKQKHDGVVALVEKMLSLHERRAAGRGEGSSLEQEIAATDKEIDNLVYELYGLTDEEIKIVEGAL